MRSLVVAAGLSMLCACAPKQPPPGPQPVPPVEQAFARRLFAPVVAGELALAGVCYGPYRAGQRPGGPDPSPEQILEDLRLIAPRWPLVRIYSSRGPAEDILRAVRDHDLPIGVLVGAWIAPDAAAENAAEVQEAIRLANAYPDQVVGVSVGNESQVYWSGHRSPRDQLIVHLRAVRAGIAQPVTTADDVQFWNKPESRAVADEVDFLLLHAYAMWNGRSLADAVPWTARTVQAIAEDHPELRIVLGETGWATDLDPDGSEVQHITAPAGEAEQATFYAAFTAWAAEARIPTFTFEAFDEPWKGGEHPRDVEKHWGLFRVDRTPKPALGEAG